MPDVAAALVPEMAGTSLMPEMAGTSLMPERTGTTVMSGFSWRRGLAAELWGAAAVLVGVEVYVRDAVAAGLVARVVAWRGRPGVGAQVRGQVRAEF